MNIAVAGTGYVGLSLSALLARRYHVTAVDVVEKKVQLINSGKSPIADRDIEGALASGALDLVATTDGVSAYKQADVIVISTPTDYDPDKDFFDTSHIEEVVDLARGCGSSATIVVKSTIPVGYTDSLVERYPGTTILFSPEFLREGHALHDNLHPSRIIVGVPEYGDPNQAAQASKCAEEFAGMLASCAESEAPTLIMRSREAEAVKLFANTYLAVRVSYFNEIDTYANEFGLDTAQIINGVCLDPRIGTHYNNPSFGYGGYCLPKDTRQLLANYKGVPQDIITAAVEANRTRKRYIADDILKKVSGVEHPVVGIYRLTMKSESDNFRSSSVQDVLRMLLDSGADLNVVVYEPTLDASEFMSCPVIRNLDEFKVECNLIVANRWSDDLVDVRDKVYTRDLFRRD